MHSRNRLLSFLLLLFCPVLLAGDLTIEVQGVPLGKRVHWLLDFSGSMRGANRIRLISFWKWALEQQPDEAAIKVSVFDESMRSYSKEWVQLPDKHAIDVITGWLHNQTAGGGTDIGYAIYYATLQDHDSEEGFDLFLITDGANTCGDFETQFEDARQLATPAIHSLGLDLEDRSPKQYYDFLVDIAEKTQGMFITEDLPEAGQGF